MSCRPAAPEGRRRRNDDEECNEVRKDHAGVDVGVHISYRIGIGPTSRGESRLAGLFVLFDHQRRLPVKQVRRNRRSEHAHHRGEPERVEMDSWNRELLQHLEPRRMHDEGRHDVSEERQRQPLKDSRDRCVRHPRLPDEHCDTEEKDERVDGNRNDEPRGGCHAADIRAQIERIGDDDEARQRIHECERQPLAHERGDSLAVDHRNASAHPLNDGHHRRRDQREPEHRISGRRAGDRIRRDSRRIVIRRARYEAGPQN